MKGWCGEQGWKESEQSEGHSRSSKGSHSAVSKIIMVEMEKSEQTKDPIVLSKATGV